MQLENKSAMQSLVPAGKADMSSSQLLHGKVALHSICEICLLSHLECFQIGIPVCHFMQLFIYQLSQIIYFCGHPPSPFD